MNDLKRLIDWALFSLIPLSILSLAAGIMSDSLTVLTISLDSGLSLIVNFFAFYSIRIVLRQNIFIFPYGTGKLENFSSFLYGTLMIPTSLFVLYFAISRFMKPPVHIDFGLTQLSSIPQFLRSLGLFLAVKRLIRTQTVRSPMLESYHVNFKVCLISDASIILAFIIAVVLENQGLHHAAFFIDPLFSLLIGIYMLYQGSHLLIANFKSLINLPLPENDQLKIMNVLTRNLDKYENIGNLYTISSGKTRFVEVELYLPPQTTVEQVTELRDSLAADLQDFFEDFRFTLVPLRHDPEKDPQQTPPS